MRREQRRATLERTYARLQTMLSQMQSQSAYLTSQLSSLPSFDTLERLSRVLDVPVREFFDDDTRGRTNAKRAALTAALLDCARELSDADLEFAVQQVQALTRHTARQRGKR